MSEPHPEIVIVRRRGLHAEAESHHGGAWKIAFADFMTAMMAFFLVLWIVSATDKNTKTLIARYFNPVKVEEPAKAQKGIHGAPEQDTDAPGADSGAPNGEKSRSDQGDSARGSVPESPEAAAGDPKQKHKGKLDPRTPPPDPARPYPSMSEAELFSDPRASLDKIAGSPPPGPRVDRLGVVEGLRGGRPERRRGVPRSVPAARRRQGDERGAADPGAPPAPDGVRAETSPAAPSPARASGGPADAAKQGGVTPEPNAGTAEAAPAGVEERTVRRRGQGCGR